MSASSTCCQELRETRRLGVVMQLGAGFKPACYHGGWSPGPESGSEAAPDLIGGVWQAGQSSQRLCPTCNESEWAIQAEAQARQGGAGHISWRAELPAVSSPCPPLVLRHMCPESLGDTDRCGLSGPSCLPPCRASQEPTGVAGITGEDSTRLLLQGGSLGLTVPLAQSCSLCPATPTSSSAAVICLPSLTL